MQNCCEPWQIACLFYLFIYLFIHLMSLFPLSLWVGQLYGRLYTFSPYKPVVRFKILHIPGLLSLLTASFQFLRGRPLETINIVLGDFIDPTRAVCWACPYHLSLFLRMMSAILYKPSLCSRASEEIYFPNLTLHIHLIIMWSLLCMHIHATLSF